MKQFVLAQDEFAECIRLFGSEWRVYGGNGGLLAASMTPKDAWEAAAVKLGFHVPKRYISDSEAEERIG